MNGIRHSPVLVLSVFIISALGASVVDAQSVPVEPSWLSGDAVYRNSEVSLASSGCSVETRNISGAYDRVYYDSNTGQTTQEVCVYYGKGFNYARYSRSYYINSLSRTGDTFSESGLAFSFDGMNVMIPSFDLGNLDSVEQPYLGDNSVGFLNQRVVNGSISYYANIREHLTKSDNGTYELDNMPDYVLMDAGGNALRAEGLGLSQNKEWLSFVSPNIGLITLNLKTFDQRRVSNRYEVYSSTWPTRNPTTSVSNDGMYVVVGGWSMETEVVTVSGVCGAINEILARDYYRNMPLLSNCPYARLTDLTHAHSPAIRWGLRDFMNVQMRHDGGAFDYYDRYEWATIYAHNMRPLSAMRYLALGDSYSSGEGDVTSDGTNHYIPGTNVAGDYSRNIPREMCHISDRSYPFLIAKQMNLSDGAMKSIACSGAVAEDALTFDLNNPHRIHADTYLGQGTQLGKLGGDGPRLSGIAGYEQLQLDALTQTLPGRIQQINHVENTQPEAITVTMGGNDLGFGAIISGCMNILNSPLKADTTCWDAQPEGRQARAQQIHDFYPRLKHLYENLRLSTESGNVFVIGYPRFFEENYICADMGNVITRTEQVSLNQLVDYANATIKNAALDAGVKYIDIANVFDGSELCGKPTSMTSINGLVAQGIMTEYAKWKQLADDNIRRYGSMRGSLVNRNPIFIGAYLGVSGALTQYDIGSNPYGALMATAQQLVHPNSYGHSLIYGRIHNGLGDELLASANCNQIVHCPQLGIDGKPREQIGAPNSDMYVPGTSTMTEGTIYLNGDGVVSVGHVVDGAIAEGRGLVIRESKKFIVRISKEWLDLQRIELQSPPLLYIYSTPIQLGEMTYDASDNSYSIEVQAPSNIGVGAHTLHIIGRNSNGRDVEIISHTYVMGPDGDIDGDGVVDESDPCAFGEPNGIDADTDGISDNCDLSIDGMSAQAALPTADTSIRRGIASGQNDDAAASETWFMGGQQSNIVQPLLKDLAPVAEDKRRPDEDTLQLDWFALVLCGLVLGVLVTTGWAYRRNRSN